MQKKTNSQLYEKFHDNRRIQKKLVDAQDYTHGPIIQLLDLNLHKKSSILDIGCGTGAIDFYLADRGHFVTGIDISEKAIKISKSNAKRFGLDKITDFSVNTIEGFKTNKKFDFILLIEVIEHIEEDNEAIKKISNLLKPGGKLILSTPSINAPLYKLGFLDNFDNRVGHLRRYNADELKDLINQHLLVENVIQAEGLVRNFMYTSTIGGKFLLKLINRSMILNKTAQILDRYALRFFGESDIIVIATKR